MEVPENSKGFACQSGLPCLANAEHPWLQKVRACPEPRRPALGKRGPELVAPGALEVEAQSVPKHCSPEPGGSLKGAWSPATLPCLLRSSLGAGRREAIRGWEVGWEQQPTKTSGHFARRDAKTRKHAGGHL